MTPPKMWVPLGFAEDVDFCFDSKRAIEINGRKKIPDAYKAYIDCRLGGCLPVIIDQYAMAWHPSTVANSFQTLQDQVFNFRHRMAKYNRPDGATEVPHDEILGTVLEVEYPRKPSTGWKIPRPNDKGEYDIPRIRAVMNLPKRAMKAQGILGSFQSGRQEWAVSIELTWSEPDSGVVLIPPRKVDPPSLGKDLEALFGKHTPEEMAQAGYKYLPLMEAPEEVVNAYDFNARMFTKPVKGWRAITLAGGIDGFVQFYGIGLVNRGAEPTAEIVEMLAEEKDPVAEVCGRLGGSIRRLTGASEKARPARPLTRSLLEKIPRLARPECA